MGTTVNLLGPPTITTDGVTLQLPPGKTSALLYYLAHQRTWVPREDLLYLFWPDHEEAKARSNLRQLLTTARRQEHLEDVQVERSRVRWTVTTDLHAFQNAMRDDQPQHAINIYTGSFLTAFRLPDTPEFESWLELERETLHKMWRNASLKHAEILREARRHSEASRVLERVLGADPLDEPAFRVLLVTLAENGLRSEAIKRFETFKERLQDELGVEPEPETRHLVKTVRAGPLQQVVPAPERAQSARFSSPRGLPRPTTGLIGRQRELQILQDHLQQPDGRLVTLLAQGGMGKTRLALEAAHRLRGAFQHGTYFIPLTTTPTTESVAPAMAEALGIDLADLAGSSEQLPQILLALRHRELLLVLDNLEHLPGITDIVREILDAAPSVRVLATSRTRLNLKSEHIIELGGLTHPASPASEDFEAFEAVNLFVTTAQRYDPAFDLTIHARDVARICALTAGMPLALEFASAWLRVLPLADIVTELESGLDLLEATETDVDNRHGSIRQVFQASWNLLSNREREALLKLSVFRGGFTREAAREAVSVGLPLLLALRNKTFLTLETTGRFSQHPLVAVFVQEQAQQGYMDLGEAKRRHAEYVFGFLKRQEAFNDHEAEARATAAILDERGNVLVAWKWAARAGRGDLFAEISPLSANTFKESGHEDELLGVTELALTQVPEDSRGWAKLVLTYCALLDRWRFQQDEDVYELIRRACEAFQRHGDKRGVADSLSSMGKSAAYLNRGETEIRSLWQRAGELYSQLGDRTRVASMLHNLMLLTHDPADWDRRYREVYVLTERIGAVGIHCNLLHHQILHLVRTYGHYDQARALVERATALLSGERDNPFRHEGVLMDVLGDGSLVALLQGDLAGSEDWAQEMLELMKPFDGRKAERFRRDAWIRLAWVAFARGELEKAKDLAERHDGTVLMVRLALLRGDYEQARLLLFGEDLERLWKRRSNPRFRKWQRGQVTLLRADVAIAGGNPNEAWELLRETLRLACELVYVPNALEAFVVAAPLLPSDEAEELLALAATHPAASFDTQQRARNLMTADPIGMGAPVLTTEEVLERGRSLLTS